MLTRWMEAVDFWIQFTARVARYPAPWIVVHRLLSAPLLLRLRPYAVAVSDGEERVVVSGRVRSVKLSWLGEVEALPAGDEVCDVEVVQVHPWAAPLWRRRGWAIVPSFVRYRAPVSEVPPARMSKSLRSNITKARRSGFVARTGHGDDWDRARSMAESWALSRFGEDAWLPPPHAWRRMRRRGRLLVIGDGSRDVAAAVVVPERGGRDLWFPTLGVASGDPELMRAGAVTAAYAAVADEARRCGAAILDAGRCSPRADDPIGAYKLRWGLRPSLDPLSPVYAVRALTGAGASLASEPRWFVGPRSSLRCGRGRGPAPAADVDSA